MVPPRWRCSCSWARGVARLDRRPRRVHHLSGRVAELRRATPAGHDTPAVGAGSFMRRSPRVPGPAGTSGGLVAALIAGLVRRRPCCSCWCRAPRYRRPNHYVFLNFDESADVRSIEWLILDRLNLSDVLFGVPRAGLGTVETRSGSRRLHDGHRGPPARRCPHLGAIRSRSVYRRPSRSSCSTTPAGSTPALGPGDYAAGFIIIHSNRTRRGRNSSDLVYLSCLMIALSAYRPVRASVGAAARLVVRGSHREPSPVAAIGVACSSRRCPPQPTAPAGSKKSHETNRRPSPQPGHSRPVLTALDKFKVIRPLDVARPVDRRADRLSDRAGLQGQVDDAGAGLHQHESARGRAAIPEQRRRGRRAGAANRSGDHSQ